MFDAASSGSPFPLIEIGALVDNISTRNPMITAPDDAFTYIDLGSLDQDEKIVTSARSIVGRKAPSRARQVVHTGDVLVSTVRPNLNGVAIVDDFLDGSIASTGFCVLCAYKKHLSTRFFFHWVRSPFFVENMVRLATGASYPAVSDAIIHRSLIPNPPLSEQHRIAAVLDQADALRAKRRAALAQLDKMAQAIFRELFGDPRTNPNGWDDRKTLGDVAYLASKQQSRLYAPSHT